MTIGRLFTIPCSLITRRVERDETDEPLTDAFGNEISVTDVVTTHDDAPLLCRYEPSRRTEHDEAGELDEDQGRIWLPPGVDVRHVDAIVVDGVGTLEVVGTPGDWIGPRRPRNDHQELTVQRTAGSEEDSTEGS